MNPERARKLYLLQLISIEQEDARGKDCFVCQNVPSYSATKLLNARKFYSSELLFVWQYSRDDRKILLANHRINRQKEFNDVSDTSFIDRSVEFSRAAIPEILKIRYLKWQSKKHDKIKRSTQTPVFKNSRLITNLIL